MRRSAWIAVSAAAAYALLSALVAVEWRPLRELDDAVARWADRTATGHPTKVDVMIVWTDVCGPWTWRLLVLALALWFAIRGLRQSTAFAILAVVGGSLVSAAMKLGVDRDRPVVDSPYTTAAGQSFPSGHASAAAIGCGVALLAVAWGRRRRAVAALAVLIPLVTAYTRIGLAVHWPSDVVGGLLLGVAAVAAAYTLTDPTDLSGRRARPWDRWRARSDRFG